MAWLNHVAIAGPRNATTSHTASASSGTVVAGSLFTPTSGRQLICLVNGAVTSTTPSGWTLPTGGSAINNTGLYLFRRTASGTTADNITTTHNGSNYPVIFDWYEFASTDTFVGVIGATGVAANGGAGPTLTGLTGSNFVGYTYGGSAPAGLTGAQNVSWSTGTESTDTYELPSGTDGYIFSTAYSDPVTAASASSAATGSYLGVTVERLVWAVSSSGGAAPAIPPIIVLAPRR